MTESFHFSPRPNRAHEIQWRTWRRDAFETAARLDRPVFLNLSAVWCHWCHQMDETTLSDPDIIALLNAETIPIRVDADRHPHLQDRYIAGGWPTNAFLTPTGEVLWAGTYVTVPQLRAVAGGVLGAWRDRRGELQTQIELRRKAAEVSRGRRGSVGLVRREAADDVISVIQESFDARNGGFGTAPKFPQPDAIELLLIQGRRQRNDDWLVMAERTLAGMLAGELWDEAEGGFYRYATAADWTAPHYEKMLDANAALLRIYALAAHLRGRDDYHRAAVRTVAWVNARLQLRDGLWGGSQDADPVYALLDADARAARARPYVDDVAYAAWNGMWIRALADAGARFGRPDWVEAAGAGLRTLLSTMSAPGDLLFHYREPDAAPALPGLLSDSVEVAAAALAVAQATGDSKWIGEAARLMRGAETALWADDGGFFDHVSGADEVGALRYRDRPFDTNAAAARVLIDLHFATGERSWRALTERILAVLSPLANRFGLGAAAFALAVEEFFEPPVRVVVVGERAASAPLRDAALALPDPARRVIALSRGGRVGTLSFADSAQPTAYVCGARSCSQPVTDPQQIARAAETIH